MGKSKVTWINHECRREVPEADGPLLHPPTPGAPRRAPSVGFSQVRMTQAYLRSVEESEREKPRRTKESGAVAGVHEYSRLRKAAL
jgi:hypothetical protein